MWNLKCPSLLFLLSARWRRTGSMWPWSLTGYSSGCLYWSAYWDLWDSFFLLGWLEWSRISPSRKGKSITLTGERLFLYCIKSFIYLFIFYFSKELQVTLLALALGYQKVTHGEMRWTIYHWFQWAYKFFMRAKGQQQKYPSAPLHFDIEPYRSSCHLCGKQWRTDFILFITVDNTTERPRHCELPVRLHKVWF